VHFDSRCENAIAEHRRVVDGRAAPDGAGDVHRRRLEGEARIADVDAKAVQLVAAAARAVAEHEPELERGAAEPPGPQPMWRHDREVPVARVDAVLEHDVARPLGSHGTLEPGRSPHANGAGGNPVRLRWYRRYGR
jgi:hypothetical protein